MVASNGSPTFTWLKDALSASTSASWRFFVTTMRVSDEQTWPVRNPANPEIVAAALPTS